MVMDEAKFPIQRSVRKMQKVDYVYSSAVKAVNNTRR
jgi:hypothetical protein